MFRNGMRGKTTSIVRSCLSKNRYDTEIEANQCAIHEEEKKGCGEPGCCPPILYSYKCKFCEGYHLAREKS